MGNMLQVTWHHQHLQLPLPIMIRSKSFFSKWEGIPPASASKGCTQLFFLYLIKSTKALQEKYTDQTEAITVAKDR
jgi:hypothetical protein